MALITSATNPTLHAKLVTAWEDLRQPGWVLDGTDHYRVVFTHPNNAIAFVLDENRNMYDSRSIIGSKPSTYSNLDK